MFYQPSELKEKLKSALTSFEEKLSEGKQQLKVVLIIGHCKPNRLK